MKLIMETDIGRDLDDFIALCYFIDAGVDLRLITISPGDPDQVALTKFLLKECGLNVPIGVSKIRDKRSVGGVHLELLEKYKYPTTEKHDGLGAQLIKEILDADDPNDPSEFPTLNLPTIEYFGCGPLDSIGQISYPFLKRATIQGGYVSYEYLEAHGITPQIKLDKFVGKDFMATFNLGGNKEAAKRFLNMPIDKKFVSKNLCHTIVYEKTMHEMVCSVQAKSRAGELLREAMGLYLKRHPEGKMFHDPSAAVCHLHPDIGTWIKGRLVYDQGKWGTIDLLPYNCEIIGNIDTHSLIHYICQGK